MTKSRTGRLFSFERSDFADGDESIGGWWGDAADGRASAVAVRCQGFGHIASRVKGVGMAVPCSAISEAHPQQSRKHRTEIRPNHTTGKIQKSCCFRMTDVIH